MWNSKLLLLAGLAVILIGLGAYYGYRTLFRSVIVEVPHGVAAVDDGDQHVDANFSDQEIEERLANAGLNLESVLGDIGISGHMERLRRGAADKVTLVRYASDLKTLTRLAGEHSVSIPTAFWDVETPTLNASGWSPYRIVNELVKEHSRPYVDVLAKSYARFLKFKKNEAGDGDTAVDAALDIMLIARNYVNLVPQEKLLQHAPEIRTPAHAVLMVWQNLVAGTSRRNPVTGKPVFTHGFLGRFNVHTMYQYDQAEPMSFGESWGVSGFAERFVGTPENNNQVEHMSISIVLQAIVGEPLLVLNAIEEEKYLLEGASGAEASADMALNRAVHDVFLPLADTQLENAVEALRVELKRE